MNRVCVFERAFFSRCVHFWDFKTDLFDEVIESAEYDESLLADDALMHTGWRQKCPEKSRCWRVAYGY